MPHSPQRGCRYMNCPRRAVPGSQYCEEHKALMDRQYDQYTRDKESRKKYSQGWKQIRTRYVREHPFCERCREEGRLTPVAEVHHIRPISRGGTNQWDNLMSLCQSCHNKIHHEMGDR